jgi:K(+)-stimulated pyrophosphate-energized sodium pump
MNLQSSGATALAIPFALICGVIAIAYGAYLIFWVLRQPAGSARMQEIAAAIQEGAMAYMRRQYTTIAIVAIILAIILGIFLHWQAAVGFLIGAILSGATGFIGMSIAVRANVRTAEAAKGGLSNAFNVAFRGGAITGLLVVGLGIIAVAGYFWIMSQVYPGDLPSALNAMSVSHSDVRSSRSSRVSAAASTRRAPTSAPISSAKSKRAFPKTTRAIRRSSRITSATTSAIVPAWPPTSSRRIA